MVELIYKNQYGQKEKKINAIPIGTFFFGRLGLATGLWFRSDNDVIAIKVESIPTGYTVNPHLAYVFEYKPMDVKIEATEMVVIE